MESQFIPINSIGEVESKQIIFSRNLSNGNEDVRRHRVTYNITYGEENIIEINGSPIIIKKPEYPVTKNPRERAKNYVYLSEQGRRIGLPVVEAKLYDNETVMMPDLTADGSLLLDKHLLWRLQSDRSYKERFLRNYAERLNELPCFSELSESLTVITDMATNEGVRLPYDGICSVRLNPEGKWDLIILDLSFMSIGNDDVEINNISGMIFTRNDLIELYQVLGLEEKLNTL